MYDLWGSCEGVVCVSVWCVSLQTRVPMCIDSARARSNVMCVCVHAGACAGDVCGLPHLHSNVYDSEVCKNVMSLMLTAGMNDFSGEWTFSVGLPAKSATSGTLTSHTKLSHSSTIMNRVASFCMYNEEYGKVCNKCNADSVLDPHRNMKCVAPLLLLLCMCCCFIVFG